MEERNIEKNVFHYNSLISVCEKMKDSQRALRLLEEMERRGIQKNEVTYVFVRCWHAAMGHDMCLTLLFFQIFLGNLGL